MFFLSQHLDFQQHMSWSFYFLFNCLKRKVVVRFIDNGRTVDQSLFSFLFIVLLDFSSLYIVNGDGMSKYDISLDYRGNKTIIEERICNWIMIRFIYCFLQIIMKYSYKGIWVIWTCSTDIAISKQCTIDFKTNQNRVVCISHLRHIMTNDNHFYWWWTPEYR